MNNSVGIRRKHSEYNVLKTILASTCSATVMNLYGRHWPVGWPMYIAATRHRPVERFKFNDFEIRRNLTLCTYVHCTQ